MFCFEKPLKACDEAIRLDPNYAAAWNNKGAALCGLKRYDEALKACDEAIRHDPNQPSAWSNKGLALNGLERYDEALKACREAIKLIIFKHFLSILCD